MTRINIVSASLIAAVLSMISFVSVAAGTIDAVSNTTVALPAGNFSTVSLLATGVDGNQTNQKFVVTYTDGTTTSVTQSLSDWLTPQHYAGESQVSQMPYRLTRTGATQNGPFYLYGYSFATIALKPSRADLAPESKRGGAERGPRFAAIRRRGSGQCESLDVAKCSGHRQLR